MCYYGDEVNSTYDLHSGPRPRQGILRYELLYFPWWTEQIPTEVYAVVLEFRGYSKTLETMKEIEKLEAIPSTRDYRATSPRDKVFALQRLIGNFIIPDHEKEHQKYILDSCRDGSQVQGTSIFYFSPVELFP